MKSINIFVYCLLSMFFLVNVNALDIELKNSSKKTIELKEIQRGYGSYGNSEETFLLEPSQSKIIKSLDFIKIDNGIIELYYNYKNWLKAPNVFKYYSLDLNKLKNFIEKHRNLSGTLQISFKPGKIYGLKAEVKYNPPEYTERQKKSKHIMLESPLQNSEVPKSL